MHTSTKFTIAEIILFIKKLYSRPVFRMMIILCFFLNAVKGQSTANYSFATNNTSSLLADINSNPIDMSIGTTQLISAGLDATASAVTNIGFDFYLMGNRFSQFSVQEDGILQLGSTVVSTNSYTLTGGTLTAPQLAAFNSDLRTGTSTGKIQYKVSGTAPNRVLVVEFVDMMLFYNFTAAAGTSKWQMRLYESGTIEYVYGTMSATDVAGGNTSPSIGFYTGSATNSFASVSYATQTRSVTNPYTSNPAITTTGAIANLTSAADGSRRAYSFTPVSGQVSPTGLGFTAVTATSMTLSWTASSPLTNVIKYAVYNSQDGGVTYNFVNTVPAGTNSLAVTGLTPGVNYLWRVYAVSEGTLSALPLSGTQATPAAAVYYYVGGATGDIATAASWNTLANNTGTTRLSPATSDILIVDGAGTTPGSAVTLTLGAAASIGALQITSNTAVTFQSSSTTTRILSLTGSVGNELDIASGSSLLMNNATQAAQIIFAIGTGMTGSIAGTLTFAGSLSNTITTTGGTGTVVTVQSTGVVNLATTAISLISSAATLSFANGSNCNVSGATTTAPPIPLATWGTTSNVTVTNVTTYAAPVNIEQSFGNLIINCPAGTGSTAWFGGTTGGVIKGDLNIIATGTGRFRLLGAGTLVINGNINATGGNFDLMNATANLTVTGNLNVSNAAKGNFANGGGIVNIVGNVSVTNTATITIGNASTTNITNITGDLNLNSSGASSLALTSGNTQLVNLNGNFIMTAGTFNMGTGTGSGILKVKGNFSQSAGTLTLTGTGTTGLIEFNGTTAQSVTFGSVMTGLISVRLNNTAGINLTGPLAINAGASYTVSAGTTTGSGTVTYDATSGKLIYNSTTGAQTANSKEFPVANGPAALTINNTAASPNNVVSVPFNRTLGTAGVLALTAGILDNSSNIVTIQNTAVTAISGGSASSYIKGVLARNLPASLASGSTYVFPLGKSAYKPFELVNSTTNAGGNVTVQAEVFDANSGGTPGNLIGSINTNRYWAASVTAGAANFINTFIRLNDTPAGADAIAASSTLAGAYDIVGGTGTTPGASSILSVSPAATTISGFYVMANKAAATLSNLVISTAGNQCTNIARTITVTATPGGAAVTSVTLNYQVNGGSVQTINMSNMGGNNWSGIIPMVTPSNGTVTWSVTATDANSLTKTQAGTAYTDEPLTGVTATASATLTTVCAGSPTGLSVSLNKTFTGTVGAGASTTSTGTGNAAQISPFFHYYGSVKAQYIVLASELQAAGLSAGKIKSLGLNIVAADAVPLTDLSLSIANTSLTVQPATLVSSGFVNVYAGTVTPVAGLNTFTFNVSDFTWNGTSNIIIQSCWGNSNAGSGQTGYTVKYDATAYVSAAFYRSDNLNGAASCASTTGDVTGTNSGRPQFIFTGNAAPAATAYSWSDGTNIVGTTNPLTVNPSVTTSYTATVTALNCPKQSDVVTITATALPAAPSTGPGNPQCGTGTPSVFASSPGIGDGNYRWYLTQTGGTALLSTTGTPTLEVNQTLVNYPITVTTTFYVSVTNGTCESSRTPVTATVNQPDPIQAVVDNNNPCANTAISLSVQQTGTSNNYTYTWTASPVNGSGIPTSVNGSPVSVTPTIANTYTYAVTAVDDALGCTTGSTVSVTVKALPVIDSVKANPATAVCAGTSVTLNGYSALISSGPQTPPTYTAPPAVANPTTDEDFGNITITRGATTILNNSTPVNSLTGTIGTATGTAGSYSNFTAFGPYTLTKGLTYNFSLSSITTGSSFSNAMALYIDYNRNGVFTDAGEEVYNQGATISGPHTVTGSFTVPANVTAGTARMRVLVNEGTISGPTITPSWGEYEEYLVNLQGVNPQNPNLTYTWTPGPLTGPTVTVTPLITTTYNLTAFDPATGCTSAPGSVTVTVNPIPPQPTGTPSDQCGTRPPDASVSSNSGAPSPTFNWYAAASGGTPLQTSTSTTYLSNISATTTLYVSEISAFGCESSREPVLITVSDPDALTVSVTGNNLSLCLGSSTSITSSYTPDFNSFATFNLTATGGSASGVTGTVSLTPNATGSDPYSITPTALGTYTYTITAFDLDKGCSAVNSVTVTVNALPTISSAVATPSTVCAGSPVNLLAQTSIISAGVKTLGAGATTASSYDGVFYNLYGGLKTQFLVKASELTALGLTAGPVTSISINMGSVSGTAYAGFAVSIGTTASTALTTTMASGLTQVYSVVSYTPTIGVNAFNFSPSFVWDGTSNIIIQFCWSNNDGGFTGDSFAKTDAPGFVSCAYYRADSQTPAVLCPQTAATGTTSNRPQFTFNAQTQTTGAGSYSWTWNPGSLSGNSVTVNPTVTTAYTATATNAAGCSVNSSPVTVTVNPLPNQPVATNSSQCGLGIPTASVSTGGANGTFKWYSAQTGGTLLQTGGSTYTTAINSTTTFWVSESNATCESLRTPVTVSVTMPDAVQASSLNGSICLNSNVQLMAVNTAANPVNTYNYTWTASPSTGSGIATSVAGSPVTITPTAAGTYVFTVTAVDPGAGCTTTATVSVSINPNPVIASAIATPAVICANGTSTLSATTNIIGAGDAASIGTGTTLTTAAGTDPTAFNNRYSQYWSQTVYTAAELHAAGLQAGNITGITYNISTLGDAASNANFSISIGSTTATTLTAFTTSGLTNVFGPTAYTHAVGLNTISFTTPYNWDGTSNIIIDERHDGVDLANNARTYYTATTGNTTVSAITTTASSTTTLQTLVQNGSATATTSTKRINVIISGQVQTTGAGSLNWVWNPGNLSGSTVSVQPASTTNYTVTATDPSTGCVSISGPVAVTVTPVTASATASPAGPVCAGSTVTLNGVADGGSPFGYSWSDGTSIIGTTASISVNPSATTTYTLTVTDNCGNTATATVTVTVNPLPTAAIQETGPINLCAPASQVLTAVTNASSPTYQWLLNGANITGATGSTYTVTSTGSYAVKVTNGVTGCASLISAATSVTVNVPPSVLTMTPASSIICNGAIVALNAAVSTSSASSGTGASTTVGNTTATTLGPNPFQIFYGGDKQQTLYLASELSALGMGTGSVISAIRFNLPAADPSVSLLSLRVKMKNTTTSSLTTTWESGMTIVRAAATVNPVIGINTLALSTPFTWDGTSNLAIEVTYSNNNSGTTGTIYNTAKYSPTSFSSTIFYRVDLNSAATLNTYTGAVTNAYNSRNDLTFDFSNPGTIKWSPLTGLYTNAAANTAYTGTVATTVYAKPAATTTYTATATSTAGCTNTGTSVITVNPRPTGILSGSTSYCNGQPTATTLSISVTGVGPWSGTLSGGITFSGSTSPVSVTVTPSSTTTYTIATLNGAQCSSIAADLSGSATVTINPRPTGVISGSGTYCNGANTATALSIALTGVGPWSGTLSDGTAFSGSTSPISVSVTPSSTTTYTIATLNGAQCSSIAADLSGSATVTVNQRPTGIISGSGTYCNGANTATALSIAVTGAGPWSGTLSGGTTFSGSTSPISVTVTPSSTTTYTIATLNGAQCSSIAADLGGSATITINPRPTGVISGGGTYCGGQGSTVTALSIAVTGAGPWSGTLSDGTAFSGSTSPVSVTVTPSLTTTYTIATLNGAQCSSIAADLSGSATVTVNPTPATPTVTAGGPTTFCSAGGSVTLSSSSGASYQWNLNGSAIGGQTGQSIVVTSSGSYTVTVTNESNCSATSAATVVTVNPTPATPTVTANGPTSFCAGGSVTLSSSSATGNQWNLNGSAIGGQTGQSLVVTSSGDYTVTVTNGFSCSATSAITTVTVNPLAATPAATVTQPTCAVGTGTINVTSPLGAGNSYSIGGAYQSSPTFSGVAPGSYTLSVQNSFGCFAPATTTVTVNAQPFTPAAPVITGIVNVCPYIGTGTQITYHATATGNGTTTFNWVIPPTLVTIISGQGTADLTVTFQAGFAAQPNKQLRVTATNQCGTSAMTIYYLLAQLPTTPNAITGPVDACPLLGGPAQGTYTINKVVGATSYLWSSQSGTTTITHTNGTGVNDTTITVLFASGFTTSAITVQSVNECGTSSARSITVTRNAPSVPGPVSGPTNACAYIAPNGTAATYSVLPVAGVTYNWTIPVGSTGLTGQGTNSISFTYPAGYTGGSLSVIAITGCGASAPRTLTITTLNPATPSVIDVINTIGCPNRQYTYSLSAMPANATSVAWMVPVGATIVSGQGTTSITVSYPGTAVQGTVTAQAINNCGSSVVRSSAVKLPACAAGFAGKTESPVKSEPLTVQVVDMEVKVFPNPSVADFKLQVLTSGRDQIHVRVLDAAGRALRSFDVLPSEVISLGSELKAGAYLVEVRQGDKLKTTKILKF